jgi:hypothetical protein
MPIAAAIRNTLLILVIYGLTPMAGNCFAQSACDGCRGKCEYCVDGQCIPRRHTFGHYQTHWRRWPVPPPGIPVAQPIDSNIDEWTDLPAVEDEGEADPDLAHRREPATPLGAMEFSPRSQSLPAPVKPDPFEDEVPEPAPAPASEPQPLPAIQPRPTDGSTTRNMPRTFPAVGRQMTRISRPRPMVVNPLRRMAPSVEALRVQFHQPIPAAVAMPARYANPLR